MFNLPDEIGKTAMFKLAVIFVIFFITMIPMGQIDRQVSSRSFTKDAAVTEINAKWGSAQTLTGPVMIVPYTVKVQPKESKAPITETRQAYFMPDKLTVRGQLAPEIRYRGIFEAILYTARLDMDCTFEKLDFESLKIPRENILWKDARLALGIADTKGIKENISVNWNGKTAVFEPDSINTALPGISVNTPLAVNAENFSFKFPVTINGSSGLSVVPVGKTTHMELASTWPSPSFTGAFLPTERQISKNGFNASWDIFYLARQIPQQWTDTGAARTLMDQSAFGVNLIMGVNMYQQTMRATKYSSLFILLTFAAFFLFELFNGKKVHPIQYLLVGFALCLFYLLLLSLAEYVGFGLAYFIASVAVIGLISAYCRSILKAGRMVAIIAGLLTFFYIYFYLLLQLEDYALLLGSIGLFILLSSLMYATRNIDWYRASIDETNPQK